MAEYKKKSVVRRKRRIKNPVTEKIPMKAKTKSKAKTVKTQSEHSVKKQPQQRKNFRILVGKNLKNKRRFVIGAIALALILSVIIVSVALPTGIIEFIENRLALVGSGDGYPHSFSSGNSLLSVVEGNNHYVAITPSNVEGYNYNGKTVFSYQHGFNYPIVKSSAERFIIYSQGGTEFSVCNLKKELFSGNTEKTILTADISDSGVYAVATQSDSYSSQVTVYDKNNKQIYKWMCADFTINNVEISPNGRRLAVSVFNTKSGKYVSKLYVLEYDSATPVSVTEFEDELILSLECFGSNTFYAVFENKVEFYNWKKLSNSVYSTDKSIFFVKNTKDLTVVVDGISANKNKNGITVFNKKGDIKSKFDFDNEIIDIALYKKYVYILSDRMIYIYNIKGELLNSVECDFGIKNIVPIGRFTVAALKDSEIKKIVIE